MFIGYPRSGHSLLGALLDAHPEIVMAHELDALKYIDAGFSRDQLFFLLLQRSRAFATTGSEWFGYNYTVPNQWQGSFRTLRVIGDKKGGESTKWLGEKPQLLDMLRERVRLETKLIHVVRNPYDNISTISVRHDGDLPKSIDIYFHRCEINAQIRENWKLSLLDVRLEDFIAEPRQMLRQLCAFLGVDAPEKYVEDCASIVFPSARASRLGVAWNPESIVVVERKMRNFDFLAGYSYDS